MFLLVLVVFSYVLCGVATGLWLSYTIRRAPNYVSQASVVIPRRHATLRRRHST